MKINLIEKTIGSGLFTGYIPFAPGTFGSLAAVLIYCLIPGFENPIVLISGILIFGVWGTFISGKMESIYGKDPSECTIDEIVGTWISLLFLPKEIIWTLIAFVIWRVMDILKPYPAGKMESIKGGPGIMLDDVVSALYTLILVHIIFFSVDFTI